MQAILSVSSDLCGFFAIISSCARNYVKKTNRNRFHCQCLFDWMLETNVQAQNRSECWYVSIKRLNNGTLPGLIRATVL